MSPLFITMKLFKKLTIVIFALTIAVSAYSQSYERAIGLKFGWDLEVEYKQHLSPTNFFQVSATLPWEFNGALASGFYAWNNEIESVPGLSWFYGPGARLGVYSGLDAIYFSVNALVGLEYKFYDIPLAISLDFTPGLLISPGIDFGGSTGLGLKYTF